VENGLSGNSWLMVVVLLFDGGFLGGGLKTCSLGCASKGVLEKFKSLVVGVLPGCLLSKRLGFFVAPLPNRETNKRETHKKLATSAVFRGKRKLAV